MDRSASPPEPFIRPLTREDAAPWRALRLKALKDHPSAFGDSYDEASERDVEAFRDRMPASHSADVLFGLFTSGELKGCAGFYVQKERKMRHKGALWGVYLDPGLRGRGLGEALVRRVIAHARENVSVLQTAVVVENGAARRLYQRLGFRPYGLEPAALRVDGVDFDEELLWAPLGAASDSLPTGALSDRRAP